MNDTTRTPTDNELVMMLHQELIMSESSPTGHATVPRVMIWWVKNAIEHLSHRVAVLETEAAFVDPNRPNE